MRRFIMIGAMIGVALLALAARRLVVAQPDIEDQQAAWEALDIQTYRIVIEDVSAWDGMRVQLWVAEGAVRLLWANCFPGMMGRPCRLSQVNAWQYTVDELFNTARNAGDRLTQVEFHPDTHLPLRIVIDDPQAMDDQRVLTVTNFEALTVPVSPEGFATATQVAAATAAADRVDATPTPLSGTATPSATPYSPPVSGEIRLISLMPVTPSGDLESAIAAAESTWNAQAVDSYTLELEAITVWDGMMLRLTVLDGEAQSLWAECRVGWMRGPCNIWSVDTASYTVPGLFERAHEAVLVAWSGHTVLTLDSASGIPVSIFYDEERTADEEWQVTVSRLVLLGAPAVPPAASAVRTTPTPTPG